NGTADRATRIAYYTERVHDLDERIAALEYLRPRRMLGSSDRNVLMRGSMDLDELARLKKAMVEYRALSQVLRAGRDPRPLRVTKYERRRDRVICFVDVGAMVYCM